jgi:hypothetical protein
VNTRPDSDYLQRAAQRASCRSFFVASALSTYQNLHQIGEDELAIFLGCSPTTLPKLALCRLPDTAAPSFRAEVERIASYTGVNSVHLAQLFREVEAITALRSARHYQDTATSQGALMAARDHLGETHSEESEQSKASYNREEETYEP